MALDAVRKCESYIQCKILSLCHKESELYFEDLAQIIRGVTIRRLDRDKVPSLTPRHAWIKGAILVPF